MVSKKGAKKKGSEFEREIAAMLRHSGLDPKAQRMVLSGGAPGFLSDIKTDLPIHFELKRQEKTSFREWYEQASSQSSGTRIPVVVWRQSHDIPFAFLSFDAFMELLTWALKGGFNGKLPFSK